MPQEYKDMHAVIPLTQGYVALVDAEDYEELSKFKWCASRPGTRRNVYAVRYHRTEEGFTTVRMHNQIMGGVGVDHITHDLVGFGLIDNRKANLRFASVAQQAANMRKKERPASSRYKGVTWNRRRGLWQAQIKHRQKNHTLGCFADEREAALAYDQAATELFRDFALTNQQLFPEVFQKEVATGAA